MIQSATFWYSLFGASVAYWVVPARVRPALLACVSLALLASVDAWSTAAVALWSVAFYTLIPFAVEKTRRPRVILSILVLGVLGALAYFKYLPLLAAEIAGESTLGVVIAPLGISYYSFKLIHYGVEVARGRIKEHSLWDFAGFLFLFPIFTAGPIERFDHYLDNRDDEYTLQSTLEGLTRIAHGLIKKLVLGDILLHAAFGETRNMTAVLAQFDTITTGELWVFCVLSYLYAYMDFSAYSDIAIGSSRLFGIRIMENFNFPILAINISDFWKRWHMTLAGFCQSYVYMPIIGLTRQPYAAVFGTFVAMGLWHAGSFTWLGWGLYHATAVSTYLTWGRIKRRFRIRAPASRPAKLLGMAITFAFISTSMVFPTSHGHATIGDALTVLAKLFFIEL